MAPAPGRAVPACRPLSKLCINSPGVVGCGAPPARDGLPAVGGVGAPAVMPVLGAPSDGAPGIEPPPCDSPEEGADGAGAPVGAGAGAGGARGEECGPLRSSPDVRPVGEV